MRTMPEKCMIAESDPFISQLLRRFASEIGMAVVQVRLGEDLLGMARQVKPDVIIVEAELPGDISGWQAIRSLRSNPELAGTAVISCSWMDEAEARSLIPNLVGHLQKPNLHYADFERVLLAIGIDTDAPPNLSRSVDDLFQQHDYSNNTD
ncbi:MAG: response regulator [Caldilineales bacterium]|nr:response regulator [Caldilineales bacterium]